MELKRRIALVAAILSVAFGAGQFVQYGFNRQEAKAEGAKPRAITQLAAGSGPTASAVTPPPGMVPPKLPDTAFDPKLPAVAPQIGAPEPATAAAPSAPATLDPAAKAETPAAPTTEALAPAAASSADSASAESCARSLDLVAEPAAMLGLVLTAPCDAHARVVIRHGGLAVTARLSTTGTLFTEIPAMHKKGEVSVLFGEGGMASAAVAVPELATLRRFGVQWMADDSFQIHAFEGGNSDYTDPGHVSAADPKRPFPEAARKGGFLSILGESDVELPMLAEVYTYPSGAQPVQLVVETAVTDTTCGRDLLGETLASFAGDTFVTELTVAMPDCDGIGDYLVLKNLVPSMNIAATE